MWRWLSLPGASAALVDALRSPLPPLPVKQWIESPFSPLLSKTAIASSA
jgi:hypothetical protein